jgi:5-methyltetrahydrofolate--homocysteine methyltransferase
MLQKKGLSGNSEGFNLTEPDAILDIHRAYIAAGADIIESNTFSANRISQKEYGLEAQAREMALAGARLARKAADEAGREVLVAGSMGPTSKSLTLTSDLNCPAWRPYSFDEMADAYAEQAGALIEGGVDYIQLETAFDALNTKAALYAIRSISADIPVVVSVSVSDASGRSLTGQTLEAYFTAVRHAGLTAFGLNCSLGAAALLPLIKDVAQWCDVPIICYPNAGLPNQMGGYDQTPADMAAEVQNFDSLVNIVGGCCGTTPEHISALPKLAPRPLPEAWNRLRVSGLEAYVIDTKKRNFTLIGERTNVAGSRKFAKLIAAGQYDEALSVAADQIDGGASVIDINMDDAMLDGPVAMETFVRMLQNDPAVARAALMIDSSNWDCILAGLKNSQGKCIVNSISLKDGEEAFLRKAREIHALGAAMVVMAFDEEGQATTYQRKIDICARSYRLLTGAGIPPQDIIFDVNVLSVGTGIAEHARYGIDFIEAVRWIKANLPGVYTSGGVSNLSFAFRGNNAVRSALHAVFLYHAIKAGLDMAIVNPGMLQLYDDIPLELRNAAEDVILCRDADATDWLIAAAQESLSQEKLFRSPESDKTFSTFSGEKVLVRGGRNSFDELTLEERLCEAIVKGGSASLRDDVLAALEQAGGEAVKVIEGPLMDGMEEVGRRFGDGKMFLPQVVKSAKVMKDAVAVLEPYMKEEGSAGKRPLVVLATVKGDVHDIGKNIFAIVLRCNGFDVQDLGVMVDKETILAEAERLKADIIAVSGLITPSLFQMEELCREMASRGMHTPLFVGGATTSDLHTAVKLAPLYDHVFHSVDASAGAVNAKRWLQDPEAFEAAQHQAQEKMRRMHSERQKPAPAPAAPYPAESFLKSCPSDIPLTSIPLRELVPLFDWRMFCAVWGVKVLDEALVSEAKALLDSILDNDSLGVRLAARFFMAGRAGENAIDLGETVLPMLRQEEGECRSLTDYVPQKGSAPFGIFAIAVHEKQHPAGCSCEACSGNQYSSMMLHSIKVVLAEAASTWLDNKIVAQVHTKVCKPAAGYASCPDHSLKRDILKMLPDGLGIDLTESCSMIPEASICGFVVMHPEAGYPEIRHIGHEQYESYARERGFSPDEARKYLNHLL